MRCFQVQDEGTEGQAGCPRGGCWGNSARAEQGGQGEASFEGLRGCCVPSGAPPGMGRAP